MTIVNYTPEETIRLLAEKAKTGTDRFVVKVSRRRGMAGLLEHIATLTEATVNHIANPETWLPILCGGGDYGLQVSHMDEVSARMGGVLAYKFQGQPLENVNTRALQFPNWNGPGSLIFPAATESGLPSGSVTGATVSGPGVGPSVIAGYGLPPSMAPSQMAPGIPMNPFMDERVERERERLAREARDLSERQSKVDRALAEREFEVREKERESKLKEEMLGRQRELESKFNAQQQNQTGVKDIVAALAPVVGMFLQSQQQARADQLRMQEESSRRFSEMMMSQQQQMQALMLKLTENKGPDPSMTMMMEMMSRNSTGNAEMMTRIVDAMGTVSKTSVGMIEAIADLQLGGQPEHPILAAVREGVKAMAQLSSGATNGARKVVQNQPQLPQGQPARAPVPQPGATKSPNGASGPQVVHEVPNAPAPNLPPASETQAFNGVEGPRKFTPVEGSVIEQLIAMIQAMHEPVDEVAQFFIDALQTNEMKAALAKHEGNMNSLFAEHLGMWAMADQTHREYIGKLGPLVEEKAMAMGLLEGDSGEEQGDEEQAEE